MGHIPDDTEWFVSELIMEITVQGTEHNVVHRNLILVRASDPETAFQKALEWGDRAEASYENPAGRMVKIEFRGISKLDVVIDPLYDGAELLCEERVGVPSEEIGQWIVPKERLEAFREPAIRRRLDPSRPDYASKAILQKVDQMLTGLGEHPAQDNDEER